MKKIMALSLALFCSFTMAACVEEGAQDTTQTEGISIEQSELISAGVEALLGNGGATTNGCTTTCNAIQCCCIGGGVRHYCCPANGGTCTMYPH